MGGIREYYDRKNAQRRTVEVPEWGMTLYVGPLTVGQFEVIDGAASDSERNKRIIKACAKKEDGAPALGAQDQKELDQFATTDIVGRVAKDIMEACAALSGDSEKKA